MIRAHFNDLPQAVRSRFSEATKTHGDPRILSFTPLPKTAYILYGLGLFVGTILVLALFSDLIRKGGYVDPTASLSTYAIFALVSAVWLSCVFGLAHRIFARPKAYADGCYVLATAIVKVELGKLEILPLLSIGRPQITHHFRNGIYNGSIIDYAPGFQVSVHGQSLAQEHAEKVLRARAMLEHLVEMRAHEEIAGLDLFAECTRSNQWGTPDQPKAEPWVPTITWFHVGIRSAVALVVSTGVTGLVLVFVLLAFADERASRNKRWAPPVPTATTPAAPTTTTPATPTKRR